MEVAMSTLAMSDFVLLVQESGTHGPNGPRWVRPESIRCFLPIGDDGALEVHLTDGTVVKTTPENGTQLWDELHVDVGTSAAIQEPAAKKYWMPGIPDPTDVRKCVDGLKKICAIGHGFGWKEGISLLTNSSGVASDLDALACRFRKLHEDALEKYEGRPVPSSRRH
jgi:hypothetical protein